jgi:hypothetical protein
MLKLKHILNFRAKTGKEEMNPKTTSLTIPKSKYS